VAVTVNDRGEVDIDAELVRRERVSVGRNGCAAHRENVTLIFL
jgi:G3E family GTPase